MSDIKGNIFNRIVAPFVFSIGAMGFVSEGSATTYSFTASGFDPAMPVDPLIGSFEIASDFDYSSEVYGATEGLVGFSANISFETVAYNYFPSLDRIALFESRNNGGALTAGTNDFTLAINEFSTIEPVFFSAAYSQANITSVGFSSAGSVTLADTPAPVPVPASLPLMALGLTGLSLVAWRRRMQRRPA